jgi:hypothetical protein
MPKTFVNDVFQVKIVEAADSCTGSLLMFTNGKTAMEGFTAVTLGEAAEGGPQSSRLSPRVLADCAYLEATEISPQLRQ